MLREITQESHKQASTLGNLCQLHVTQQQMCVVSGVKLLESRTWLCYSLCAVSLPEQGSNSHLALTGQWPKGQGSTHVDVSQEAEQRVQDLHGQLQPKNHTCQLTL